jgi:HSP20 family protein
MPPGRPQKISRSWGFRVPKEVHAMLDALKRVGQDLGTGVQRALERLADGWQALRRRSAQALTPFFGKRREDSGGEWLPAAEAGETLSWGLVAGDVYDEGDEIVVRVEIPGLESKDLDVQVEEGWLVVRGEKRHEHREERGHYYLAECAYGWFERAFPLPDEVDATRARARYRHGVLTVRLPKAGSAVRRRITVH